MDKIIRVENLVKRYGKIEAVNNISFEVERGSLFAFLGTNGAGKTTTIDILCTLITKNEGSIWINGWEIGKEDHKIRDDIGIVFQNSVLDNLLTVRENLFIRGSFYGYKGDVLKERILEAAKVSECEDLMERTYGKLSGGQKRRVDIARALINQPKILFLDEPTTGLDPKTRMLIWNTIEKMQKNSGMTVFLTTHYMEEASKADYLVIIGKGKIIEQGNPKALKEKYTKDLLKIYNPSEALVERLNKEQIEFTIDKEVLLIGVKSTQNAIALLKDLEDMITSFEVIKGNMDDVFLNVQEKCMGE